MLAHWFCNNIYQVASNLVLKFVSPVMMVRFFPKIVKFPFEYSCQQLLDRNEPCQCERSITGYLMWIQDTGNVMGLRCPVVSIFNFRRHSESRNPKPEIFISHHPLRAGWEEKL